MTFSVGNSFPSNSVQFFVSQQSQQQVATIMGRPVEVIEPIQTKKGRRKLSVEGLVCRMCGATSTPEWRRNRTLCNACGIRLYKAKPKMPSPEKMKIAFLLNEG